MVREDRPDGKRSWQEHLAGAEWKRGRGGAPLVLFRLPETRAAISRGETVYVPEGEKCVEALVALGLPATCNPGGAGKWRPEHTTQLEGVLAVRIFADADEPGR